MSAKTEVMTSGEFKEWAGLIAAIIAATLAVAGLGGRLASFTVRTYQTAVNWINAPRLIMKELDTLKGQMLPNGGSSLKDAITRLERGVRDIRNAQIENAQKLQSIVINDDTGFWESDAAGNCTDINAAILKRVGFTSDQAHGNGWVNFIWPDHRDKVFKAWRDACEQKRDFVCDYSFVSQEGHEIPIRAHSYIIRDMDGNISKFIGLVKFI